MSPPNFNKSGISAIAIASVAVLTGIGIFIFLMMLLPDKPGEPSLWRNVPPDLEEMDCSRGGVIKSTQDINKDFEVLLVHNANEEDDVSWGALAHKQDNFKIGTYVQICYVEVLNGSRGRNYSMVGLAKRDEHTKYPFDSELEKLGQCQEDLESAESELSECNAHVSTLLKAVEQAKEAK